MLASGLTRIERASIKELALDQLKQFIVHTGVAPGQRLPSERELAEQLGVGRNSVREALKIMEAVGLVESRIGEGTFVVDQVGASIGRHIGFSIAVWGSTTLELMDARLLIEVEAARVASARICPEVAQAMQGSVDRMGSAPDYPAYLTADMAFHQQVAQATRNEIIARIVHDLTDLLQQAIHQVHADRLMARRAGAFTHQAILDAIIRNDGTQAASLMREHLEFAKEMWQTVISVGTATAVPLAESG